MQKRTNGFLFSTMNRFGDERLQSFENALSPETAECLTHIALETHLIILNVTYWECHAPWLVPERRICDNFMLFVESGEESISVRGEKRILRRGDGIIVPEFEPHSFGLAEGCSRCTHLICHALTENIAGGNPFACFQSPFVRLKYPSASLAELKRIAMLCWEYPDAASKYMRAWLRSLMADAAEEGNFHPGAVGCREERIRKALRFIGSNFRGNIAVADIAAHTGLREVRFRALFKKEVGMTPAAYLLRCRLLHAARLLARWDQSVRDVALASGFSSSAYFCTAFRQMFRRTPNAYRELIRR